MAMERRIRVLTLGDMDADIDAALGARFDVVGAREATDVERDEAVRGIVTRGRTPIDAALMDRLPRLETIATISVGYDTIAVAEAVRRGIVVSHTPDVLNDEMADFTVGLLLATLRRLPAAERHLREGSWRGGADFPLSPSLRGRTVGIVGMGRIGTVIARRLEGFEVPIAYFARSPRATSPHAYHDDLLSLARAVDTLIVVLPGGAATRHAIDAAVLSALGPDGVLINVARGSVVDEAALIEALRRGDILAAGLDVFADEPRVPDALLALEQVVLLPHVGTATHHTRGRMGRLAVDNVVAWFDGRDIPTPIPECGGPRLPAPAVPNAPAVLNAPPVLNAPS